MPELLTPRLRCSPLQLDDWSFFLSLQQDPQVMLYVADPRPQAAILSLIHKSEPTRPV